jgi:hypothetical protein
MRRYRSAEATFIYLFCVDRPGKRSHLEHECLERPRFNIQISNENSAVPTYRTGDMRKLRAESLIFMFNTFISAFFQHAKQIFPPDPGGGGGPPLSLAAAN